VFPKGFPLFGNSGVAAVLLRSSDFLVLFLIRFSKNILDDSSYRLDALVPPRLRIDIERDASRASCVAHVVTGNLEASTKAPHEAGVHGPKAPEVDCRWQTQIFCYRLQVPIEQIMPIQRFAHFVGKNKVIRLTELLVACPESAYRSENNVMIVKRDLPFASIRLHVVELIVVNTFVYDYAIAKNVFPEAQEPLRAAWTQRRST